MNSKGFKRFYVDYIIKKPVIFYSFLGIGIGIFLYLSLNLKLDRIQSVNAEIVGQTIKLEGEYKIYSDSIYLYHDRNKRVYKLAITDWKIAEGCTVCMVEDTEQLSGGLMADIITGKQTLFERIFLRAGKR